MAPRWLNDLVRIYAICVGGLTLFLIGVILYAFDPYLFLHRHELDARLVLGRAVGILLVGSLTLFVIGAIMMGCYRVQAKPPMLLIRGWWFSLFLSIFTGVFVFPILAGRL